MSGTGESQGGSVIPNGQPPQWNYPGKLRPQHNSSNGTPTPPTNSYAGSLSSQSSRDPSPIPASGEVVRSPPDVQQPSHITLVRQSPDIVNGPQVASVQGSVPPSSHSSSTSASSYSNPDLSPSEPDGQAMSHSSTSAYSLLDSATRHLSTGDPSYRPLNSGSNYTAPPANMGSLNITGPPEKGHPSLGTSVLAISVETSHFSGPPQAESPSLGISGTATKAGTSNLSEHQQMKPPMKMGASNLSELSHLELPTSIELSIISGPPQVGTSSVGVPNISGPLQVGTPTSIGLSNISGHQQIGPPTNMGTSRLSGPPQTGPPTNTGASNISASPQMGPPISVGTSNLSGPPQMGPPISVGTLNISAPPQIGSPTSVGTSNLSGSPQMGPPTSVETSNLSGPSQMGPPASVGMLNISEPPQMGLSTSVGTSNLSGPQQMGPPLSVGTLNISGPPQMGPPTSVGTSNLSGPPQMGPPTNVGTSNLSGPQQIGLPTRIGVSNLSGPPQMGLSTNVGVSNLSGPPQMGPPTNVGTSNLSGLPQMGLSTSMEGSNPYVPQQMGPPTSLGVSNLSGPPQIRPLTNMGGSNLYGPPQRGPPTSMAASNLSRPLQMGAPTRMAASSFSALSQIGHPTGIGGPSVSRPPPLGPPTSMAASNLTGPFQMAIPTSTEGLNLSGPPTSLRGSNFYGPPQLGLPISMEASNLSGSSQTGPPTSIGASNLSGPPQMGPPTSIGPLNISGPHQMGPPTSMGASNVSGPPQMGPPTSIVASNLSGPHQMGPPTSIGASNLSGPHQMGPPMSVGALNISRPHKMGPSTNMGASNLSGPHQMGPPTSMGASNLSGAHQMGPSISMGATNVSGPHRMGPPTSMGATNVSGPHQMGPPTSMGASNLSGPHQMGPPTTMGASNLSAPNQMGPPTSMGASNLSGPHQMGLPTSMGASNLSAPHQMGPPTSMGASNLSAPHQMGPPTSMGASNLSAPNQMGPPTSMGALNLSAPRIMGPQMSNLAGPPQMGPATSMGRPSPFGPRAGVWSPTSMESSSFAGPATGPLPRSMAPPYTAGPPPGPSIGYMASQQGDMPPTRPSQYPGVPSQTGSIAQDHKQNYQQFGAADTLASQFSNMSVARTGFNKIWGMDSVDLLQYRNVLPAEKVQPPKVRLHQEFLDSVNCSPDIFRCTLTKIPENNSLLQKSRLPLGILIHPFKDLNHLPVIQCSTIVRCRSCRTYINPFVYFVDHKRWKCNLCFRVNELPEEFQYDPVSKTYGDPTRRPEIKSSTIEFIAPSEYMLRPPQPAVYLFLLDVSRLGVESGYLNLFSDTLLEELDKLPGDGRTQIGFITYDSSVHFYNLAEGLNQPQQMIVVDTEEVFLPCPDNLLVNLAESRELVMILLKKIPTMFLNSHDTKSSLGPALQAAYKLMAPTGGRVTVFQSCLPNHGPGALVAREDPSQRAGKDAPHLNPVTDFYKRLALDCSGQQIAVDLFIINSQYCDIATISGISRFSGGCIHHFPLFKTSNAVLADNLERCFRRYLTRKIGFEAVMRIRCSRGLAIHTFHGNFFVRSTDLLSLPNVNPDAGFGMQVSVEESLSDIQNICFQAALLYTSSKGERRIRVHTLCLPVAATLSDILYSADQQCIVGLLAKMAVDRSLQSSLSDARDAFINVAIDVLSVYKLVENSGNSAGLLAPMNLRLLPLYILALLKYVAFRTGQSTRLDDRLFAMCQMKTMPLSGLIQAIYPDLYPVHCLDHQNCEQVDVDGTFVPQPPRLHLSAEKLESRGAFLMDAGDHMMMYVGNGISNEFCCSVLGVAAFSQIPEEMYELPEIESPESERLRNFVNHLQSEKPHPTMLQVIRDDSNMRGKFIERLIEDRSEAALSYYEFLQHLKANVVK